MAYGTYRQPGNASVEERGYGYPMNGPSDGLVKRKVEVSGRGKRVFVNPRAINPDIVPGQD